MGLYNIFIVALMPVLKVLLLTALGSFLAIDRVDILGEEARKHLNKVVFFVFNPSLVASHLANSITYKSMTMLWFMPFNTLITFIIGSLLGWMLIKFTRTPHELRGLVLGCCAAGNLGNMPLIIIPAVCKERGSLFGDPDKCYAHGMAYVSLSMAIGAIILWSYVYNLVHAFSVMSCEATVKQNTRNNSLSAGNNKGLSGQKFQLLPLQSYSHPEDNIDQLELDIVISDIKSKVSFLEKSKHFMEMVLQYVNPKRLFAPSTIGATAGFVIGTVPQFHKVLVGDRAPLRVIHNSASLLGDAAIPTITLIVGANLLKGLRGSKIPLPVVAGIVAVRYVLLPLLGIVIVRGAVGLGFVQSDPLYKFVLLLQFALPPAINIGTMTQLFGVGEKECSVIMLWTYALSAISLTLWSAFFMWLVG